MFTFVSQHRSDVSVRNLVYTRMLAVYVQYGMYISYHTRYWEEQ